MKKEKINRRNFLKTIGVAGITPSLAAVTNTLASSAEPNKPKDPNAAQIKLPADPNKPADPNAVQNTTPQVPKRDLGKTGIKVSCLGLGGDFSFVDKQIVLRKCVEWGVTSWDTAWMYGGGGQAELGFGQYIASNPGVREKLVITTRSAIMRGPINPAVLEERLQTSLKRMNLDYVDIYHVAHQLTDPATLTDEVKQWVESAKKRKLIRFTGFTTHSNMANCLNAAVNLGWIDSVMTLYNFRLMQDSPMQAALDACKKAGVGVVAMKALSSGVRRLQAIETEEDKKLTGHFLEKGFTDGQAKIKAVMGDERISSVCVGMDSVALVTSNVAAALDRTTLAQDDMQVLSNYAQATCSGYCAGCSQICDSALGGESYVRDIMRYLMYYNSYGDKAGARAYFSQIPSDVRNRLLATDYSLAESRCPQRMPIREYIAEAVEKLA
jgi:uncharacterized protein